MTNIRHQPLVEPDIMHGNEDGAKHFAREKKVPDRTSRKSPAGITPATAFYRTCITLINAVPQPDRSAARERIGIAAIAGRQHAIEHINPRGNRGHNVTRITDAHQLSG